MVLMEYLDKYLIKNVELSMKLTPITKKRATKTLLFLNILNLE